LSERYRTGSGGTIEAGERLAAGAAGVALAVRGNDDIVLKILDAPSSEDERRVRAMLSLDVPLGVPGAAAVIAWPTDLLFDRHGRYVGFVMPRAPQPRPVTVGTVALRSERERNLHANLGWDARLEIAANYSAAVAVLHSRSVVVCDINLKNAMVSADLTVTVIDCDSMQVQEGGRVYPSRYFQEEFLAPELKGATALRQAPRKETSDRWSLAVLAWQILMDGHHPFDGRWRGSGEQERDDHIKAGRFPHNPRVRALEPSPEAPPWRVLPRELQKLFLEAFTAGAKDPSKRPSALRWAEGLRGAAGQLERCDGASGRVHLFPAAEPSCPWCEYERYLRADPPKPAAGRRRGGAPAAAPPRRPSPPPRVAVPPPRVAVPAPPPPIPAPPPAARRSPSFPGGSVALATFAVLLIAIVIAIGNSDGADEAGSSAGTGFAGGNGGQSDGGAAAARRRAARWAPARAVRSHYVALGEGAYRRAFGFMAPAYRREKPRWLKQVRESQPRVNLVHVGKPLIRGGVAWVPTLFFARDTYDTVRSDTLCRRFEGPVHMVRTYEGWRYDPTEDFAVTEKPGGAPRCP
jgi:DNA-binding helix-hairpin-helix protein with protein kinase domain